MKRKDRLNLEKRYFVQADGHLKSVLESWAHENGMELIGEEMSLDLCKQVYELNVQQNDDLWMDTRRFGVGYSSLVNGERTIGDVKQDALDGRLCVLIKPEVRDR